MRFLTTMMLILSASAGWAADHEIFRASSSGHLVIDANGAVVELQLDQKFGKLIDPILQQRIQAWRFEPIKEDGKPVRALAHFNLTLQADFGDKSLGQLRIVRANFVDPPVKGTPHPRSAMTPPRYPREALESRLGAEIVLLVKIDEAGNVLETSGQNSWLIGRGRPKSEKRQDEAMKAFIAATETAVQQWQFPELAAQGKSFVEVPVQYTLGSQAVWRRSYFVPFEKEPWTAEIDAGEMSAVSSDGSPIKEEFRLLDPLDAES